MLNQLKFKKIFFVYILIGIFISIAFVALYNFLIIQQEMVISNVKYASIVNYSNNIPLDINYEIDDKDVYDDKTEILIHSNKKLVLANFNVISDEFDDSLDEFVYKIEINNIGFGENRINLTLEDPYSNSQEITFTIFRKNMSQKMNTIPDFEDSVISPNYNSLLALVSKKYKLPSNFVPKNIVYLPDYDIPTTGGGHLRLDVAKNLKNMINAMKLEGIDLKVSSSYRSYDVQIDTYNYWLKYNNWNYNKTDNVSARPGHSEHQLATTIDVVNSEINDKLTQGFGNTKAFMWLENNAYKYGFVMSYPKGKQNITGYVYEPWHWRYIGIDEAKEFKSSGLTLIEYLKSKLN